MGRTTGSEVSTAGGGGREGGGASSGGTPGGRSLVGTVSDEETAEPKGSAGGAAVVPWSWCSSGPVSCSTEPIV